MSSSRTREHPEQALTGSEQPLSRTVRFFRFQVALWRYCARRLREHDVMGMSAALCYRSIFTMIPILVLGLLVAKSLGTLEDSKRSLRRSLEAIGFAQIAVLQEGEQAASLPPPAPSDTAAGEAAASQPQKIISVADEIEKVVSLVEGKLTFARIGPVGGALLIWTAIGLLSSLEQSLNRIFGAARSRSAARRLLLYWSALTLGPVTLAAASFLGEKAIQVFGRAPGVSRLLVAAGWVGPIVVGVLVLATLYKLLPNTTVRWRSAIVGATVATVLWLVAKWGFAVYVQQLVFKGNLYGVLGVLPLFLLWLYYSWLILLFGAELAHTAVNVEQMRRMEIAEKTVLGPSDVLAAAVAVAQPFESGRGPVALDEIAGRLQLPPACAQALLDRLVSAGFVCAGEEGPARRYLPARPPAKIPVLALLDLGDPRAVRGAKAGHEPELATVVSHVQSKLRSAASGATLRDVLDESQDPCIQPGPPPLPKAGAAESASR